MKALNVLLVCLLAVTMAGVIVGDVLAAETRTLTTTILITVKAADPQPAKAPAGLENLYNSALGQSQQNRFVKVEEPLYTPNGLPRYTMAEKL